MSDNGKRRRRAEPPSDASTPAPATPPSPATEDAPGASAQPAVPLTKSGKPDRRYRAAHPEDPNQPVGVSRTGGGVGAKLTREEREQLRKSVRAARKETEKQRREEAAALAEKGRNQKGQPRAKLDGKAGAPAWDPTKYDLAQVEAMSGLGIPLEDIGMVLGISTAELHNHHDEFKEYQRKGQVLALSRMRQAGFEQAVGGSLGHWKFMEERVFGYRPSGRVEHTGKDGGPIEQKVETTGMTDQQIESRLRTLVDRIGSVVHVDRPDWRPPNAEQVAQDEPDLADDDDAADPTGIIRERVRALTTRPESTPAAASTAGA